MKPFVLNQQLPEENSKPRATASSEESASWQYAEPLTQDACRCPHLEAWLPHILNLECIRNSDSDTWRLSNPIHALHLASHTNPDGTTVTVGDPFMYGEEERRTKAVQIAGIAASYSPMISSDRRRIYPPKIKKEEASKDILSSSSATSRSAEESGGEKPTGVVSLDSQTGAIASSQVNTNDVNRIISAATPIVASSAIIESTVAEIDKPTEEEINSILPVATTSSEPDSIVSQNLTGVPAQKETADENKADITDTASGKQDSSQLTDKIEERRDKSNVQSEAKQAESSDLVSSNKEVHELTGRSVIKQEHSTEAGNTARPGEGTTLDKINIQAPDVEMKVKEGASIVDGSGITGAKDSHENTDSKNLGQPKDAEVSAVTSGNSLAKTCDPSGEDGPIIPGTTNSIATKVESSPDRAIISTIEIDPMTKGRARDAVAAVPSPPEYLLSLSRYQHLRHNEQGILKQRRALSSKQKADQGNKKKVSSITVKKRKNGDVSAVRQVGSSRPSVLGELGMELGDGNAEGFVIELDSKGQLEWEQDAMRARCKVEEWMEVLRLNRRTFWNKKSGGRKKEKVKPFFFGGLSPQFCPEQRCDMSHSVNCHGVSRSRSPKVGCVLANGDELLQCLECSFIGCAPCSTSPTSREHIIHHLLETNHTFAISCGPRADLFCFRCGDFVYHEVFDQEKERIEVSEQLPWMGWKEHAVQRSFNAMNFLTSPDHGVVWRGLIATYPTSVPKEYVLSARLSMKRLRMFRGETDGSSLTWSPEALDFTAFQLLDHDKSWRLRAPVGLYNLGNTCFMSAVIQCLVHCVPLQRHFLADVGHHYESCQVLRRAVLDNGQNNVSTLDRGSSAGPNDTNNSVSFCLACEMDILYLRYFGSTVGKNAIGAIHDPTLNMPYDVQTSVETGSELKGAPLVTSDLLSAAWRSGGMDHLAGYEQRDAHEFLQAFLDIMGKHESQHRKRLRSIADRDEYTWLSKQNERDNIKKDDDVAKHLFEGTLRSVLICEECGHKRSLSESFLNISLPLEAVEQSSSQNGGLIGTRLASSRLKLSVQQCLDHFTAPESLGDPVHCPSCEKKTATKKQHTFAKLPRVLCLHLKRFDAANNKKIEDFVSFPSYGLDMGQYLPHWCEVMQGASDKANTGDEGNFSSPQILYDLFGTVNHTGNLNQGHYVSNVKVNGQWYHCNDAFVCKAGNGDGEENVLKSEGAYVLFYVRR